MPEMIETEASTIALGLSRGADRRLLEGLLEGHQVHRLDDAIPTDAALCIVDVPTFDRLAGEIDDWKAAQRPRYAPVLLLASEQPDPWTRYAEDLGTRIDAIQPIPVPREALKIRIERLLETRAYAAELDRERRFTTELFTNSPVAKTVLDPDGTILRANELAEELLGLPASAIEGRRYDEPDWRITDTEGEPIPSEDLPFARVLATGEPVYGEELAIERPDDTWVEIAVDMHAIRDDDGDIEYLVSGMQDVTERRRLTRELAASEELHRAVLANITDTVVITDDDGRFTYVCPNVDFIFGYDETDVADLGTVDALLGDDPAPPDLGSDESVENVERVVVDANDREHTVLVTVRGVDIAGGTRLYSVRDVTELVESERLLAAERERLETVVSHAPLVLVGVDADRTITHLMGEQMQELGLDRETVVGRSIEDVFGDVPTILAAAERVFAGESFAEQQTVGDRVFDSWHQPVVEAGEVVGAVVVAHDVTERERQAERFQAFVEHSSDIIAVHDAAGTITYVSPSVERVLGYDPDDLLGRDSFELIHPEDRPRIRAALDQLVESPGAGASAADPALKEVYRTRHADGTYRWTETRATPQPGLEDGEIVVNTREVTERVEAERAYREADASRSLALSAAQAGVWEWDLETDEVRWHESCEAVFGLEPGSFEGTFEAFAAFVHPADLEAVQAAIELAAAGEEPLRTTFRIERADGETRWLDARGTLLYDEAGEPDTFIGVDIDVTERRRREQELERYEQIVETAADPIYVLDGDGGIQLVNPAFERAVGRSAADLVGTNITDLLAPEDVDASLEHIRALRTGEPVEGPLEVTLKTAEGPRQYEVNVTLREGEDTASGTPGTVGVARDVTLLREHERELRRAEQAIDASGHAIYITDIEGHIEYVNPAFEAITGYEAAEALGRKPNILKSGQVSRQYYQDLWGALLAGETWHEEIVNTRKNGEPYHALQTMAPILDEGEIEGFVAIQTDITEHKDRIQQLRVLDRVLRHNLHNDMNVVLGYADLIEDAAEGADAEPLSKIGTYARRITEHSDRLLGLTDKQRRITEVLSAEPTFVSVDLVEIVRRVVADVAEDHPSATVDADCPETAIVRATENVERAVHELVENAVLHNDGEHPTITVTVSADDEEAVISVADDGPGIPSVERQLVTGIREEEPLYHGSGLGLWLVAWIVRRSNGTLEFSDNEPRGSVVTIHLKTNVPTEGFELLP